MSFAAPNQLLVSRSFYEVVSCLSRDYASLFRYEGARTDKHVRAHEVYAVGGDVPAARRVAETALRVAARGGLGGWILRPGLLGFQRSALLAAPLLFLLIVGAGLASRPTSEPASRAAPPALKEGARAARSAPVTAPTAPSKASSAAAAPGRVRLAIAPWGAVYVDGAHVGVSPPLRQLELPPGTHRIEIRNTNFAPRVETVELKSGGEATVRHRFR